MVSWCVPCVNPECDRSAEAVAHWFGSWSHISVNKGEPTWTCILLLGITSSPQASSLPFNLIWVEAAQLLAQPTLTASRKVHSGGWPDTSLIALLQGHSAVHSAQNKKYTWSTWSFLASSNLGNLCLIAHSHGAPSQILTFCFQSDVWLSCCVKGLGFSGTKELSTFLSLLLSLLPIFYLKAKIHLVQDFPSPKSRSAALPRKHKPVISNHGHRALWRYEENTFHRCMSQLQLNPYFNGGLQRLCGYSQLMNFWAGKRAQRGCWPGQPSLSHRMKGWLLGRKSTNLYLCLA